MIDLNACSLFLSTILFFFPGIAFLVLAVSCGYHSRGMPPDGNARPDQYCFKIDKDTSVIMFVFGVSFLLLGILIGIFAVLIQITNGRNIRKVSNQGESLLC